MGNNITVLNFDHAYEKQSFLHKQNFEWLDLQSIQNTNLFCERETLRNIARKLKAYKNKVTLIGSGNYHYMTYLLLANIQKPFTLVLFDHHTDTLKGPSDDLISCGSWVLDSLENYPNLEKVTIIGVSEEGETHIPDSIEGKVRLYSKHYLRLNGIKTIDAILNDIQTDDVYISIDKDVLNKKDAITAWDHGNMRLRQLLTIVKKVIQQQTISGIDICGEYPNRSNEFGSETKKANDKNGYANKLLLTYIQRWLTQYNPTTEELHA